ncbi:MAG TPA: tetratricopeptide repeat protein, partial [Candidatus Angelobacter sp.]|nr:tetratricopeptide repeat protein [Candidatus Angelobacter sp.]
KVKEYAQRALKLDDGSAEAHTSMAIATLFGEWDWKTAEEHVQHAIQLNAGYSTAHLVYSVILVTSGRVNLAIEQDRLAMDLDPLSLIVNWNATSTFFLAGRFDEAIAQAKRTIEIDPTSSLPQGALARTYEQTGRLEEGLEILRQHFSLPGVPAENRAMVDALIAEYRKGGVAGYWGHMLRMELGPNPRNPKDKIRIAMIYTKLGDKDKALSYLERAYAEHAGDMIFINVEPSFEPIRREPRLRALARKVGIPGA